MRSFLLGVALVVVPIAILDFLSSLHCITCGDTIWPWDAAYANERYFWHVECENGPR